MLLFEAKVSAVVRRNAGWKILPGRAGVEAEFPCAVRLVGGRDHDALMRSSRVGDATGGRNQAGYKFAGVARRGDVFGNRRHGDRRRRSQARGLIGSEGDAAEAFVVAGGSQRRHGGRGGAVAARAGCVAGHVVAKAAGVDEAEQGAAAGAVIGGRIAILGIKHHGRASRIPVNPVAWFATTKPSDCQAVGAPVTGSNAVAVYLSISPVVYRGAIDLDIRAIAVGDIERVGLECPPGRNSPSGPHHPSWRKRNSRGC